MKRRLAILLLLIIAAPAVWADQDNVRCLRSIGVQPLLRIQFGLDSTNDSSGHVLYQGCQGVVPLKLLKVTELRRADGGRPSEIEIQWIKVTTTPSAGRYLYTNEGALIDDFHYIRSDGRVFKSVDDSDGLDAGRCTWTTPWAAPLRDG
jgi:hypothetical protein